MKSCIITVVKNEHLYLDEWIKYHLDLGINHIFIFEDIDSDSHKEITNRYGDWVSLNSVCDILNKNLIQIVSEYKKIKNCNPQILYFRTGLKWIKDTCSNMYDWCFVIDNDEFITLEKKDDKLEDVISLYKDYDAFIMQWQCYGANGLIKTPDYTQTGVVDTYTKKSKVTAHSNPLFNSKVCYNLNTYQEIYLNNVHLPLFCKWCRSDFGKKPTYKNIYLRHYITKSWEEYIAKRKRGYFMGLIKTTNFFFRMNKDMLNIKDELIKSLE